jgi:hypothetical protein
VSTPPSGADLYERVQTYCRFGNHLTGTVAEQQSAEWLVRELSTLGAKAHIEPFDFDRFICQADLRNDGGPVPCLPVFYSAIGSFETDDIELIQTESNVVGDAVALDPILETTFAAVVIAVAGPPDLAVQANRFPNISGDVPAVIVPGNWWDRLGDLHLKYEASLEPGVGRNVLATLGPDNAPAITVTTPLTGWTPCAGERATGIVAALVVAADLASDHRVTFVGAGGHELHFLGLEHYLANHDATGSRVVQLGASVAAVVPSPGGVACGLDPQRLVLTTAVGASREAIAEHVPRANWQVRELTFWPGESGMWQRAGAEVLAFLGHSTYFHTTSDVPELATTPEALELATGTALSTARLFLNPEKATL